MNLFLTSLLILSITFFSGCEVAEPERYYNAETEKPVSGILYTSNFDSTKIYRQNEVIKFRIDSTNFEIKSINLFMDELPAGTFYVNSFSFPLNPKNLSDGEHSLLISIAAKHKGLLTLNEVGILNYLLKFTTYSAESLKTVITKIELNGKPQIYWTECRDMYFENYKLVRKISNTVNTIAFISDQGITSFVDSSFPDIYGKGAALYQIVSNSKYSSYVSEQVSFDNLSVLDILPLQDNAAENCFTAVNDGSLIFYNYDTYGLEHVDLNTGTVISRLSCHFQNSLRFSISGVKVLSKTNEAIGGLTVVDYSNTISNLRSYLGGLDYNLSFAEIFPNMLLTAYTDRNWDEYIRLFCLNEYRVLKEIKFDTIPGGGTLLTTNKNGYAFYKNSMEENIYRIDARDTSNITAVLIKEIQNFRKLNFIKTGKYYLETNNSISICGDECEIYETREIPDQIVCSNTNSNIAVVVTKKNNSSLHNMYIYDLETLNIIRNIIISFPVESIIIFPDNSIILNSYDNSSNKSTFYKLK